MFPCAAVLLPPTLLLMLLLLVQGQYYCNAQYVGCTAGRVTSVDMRSAQITFGALPPGLVIMDKLDTLGG